MRSLILNFTIILSIAFFLTSCGNTQQEAAPLETDVTNSTTMVAQLDEPEALPEDKPQPTEESIVKIQTTMGDIEIKLYAETKQHHDNFIKLADSAYFDGTLFHRVIQGFMIQGGDPDSKKAPAGVMLGNGGPGYTIPAEFMPQKYFHKRGALAAARNADNVNPKRASSGSQFYIVQGQVFNDSILNLMEQYYKVKFSDAQRTAYKTVGGAPHLDGAYTVFGEVVKGMDVVDRIAAVAVDPNKRPLKDVRMTSVKVIRKK